MRVQEINGVRTPIVDDVTYEVFEQIVSNFRVLTGEETLEFATADQVRSALESMGEVIPVLQKRTSGSWLIIQPNQLPQSSIGEVVDLSTPLQIKPAVQSTMARIVAAAPAPAPVAPKPARIKPVVDSFILEHGDSAVELSGPQARVLNDVLFAVVEDSYADLDTEDTIIAITLSQEISAEDGLLETVIVRSLEMIIDGEEIELTRSQREVAEQICTDLSEHVAG